MARRNSVERPMKDAPPFAEIRKRFLTDPRSLLGQIPGVFLVDKPSGWTSHDVVARARRRLAERRVGHAGTLDPMATGLLVLLAGNATRLFDDFQTFPKTYRAVVRFGARTDTFDVTGNAMAWTPANSLPVPEASFFAALDRFRGDILQRPPAHSALKKNGRPLYAYARAGEDVQADERPATVHELSVIRFDGREAELDLTVARGFYVRSLAEELGLALGVGGVLAALRRTASGPFRVGDAVAPDALRSCGVTSSDGR